MFYEAAAFDQDLGWCVDDDVDGRTVPAATTSAVSRPTTWPAPNEARERQRRRHVDAHVDGLRRGSRGDGRPGAHRSRWRRRERACRPLRDDGHARDPRASALADHVDARRGLSASGCGRPGVHRQIVVDAAVHVRDPRADGQDASSTEPARPRASPRNDLVKNYRAPDTLVDSRTGARPRRRRERDRRPAGSVSLSFTVPAYNGPPAPTPAPTATTTTVTTRPHYFEDDRVEI